jgi:diadenylate cyclase
VDRLIEFFTSAVGWLNLQYLFEILIIYAVIYTFLRFMEGTRGEGILKGIALLMLMFPLLLTIIAERLDIMDRLLVIIRFFGAAAIPALVIIVQPELRRALVRLGQTRLFGAFFKGDTEGTVEELVKAAFRMSRRKIGALIAIEREVGMKNYVEHGTQIDAVVTSELLSTVFFPGSDLHDGAVVVQKERVAAAGCLFPLSENPNIGSVLGTRHRAALGVTEETDAIVIVVSEETGIVSFVNRGQMERVDVEQLRALLLRHLAQLEDRGGDSSEDTVQETMGARGR